MQTEKLDVIFDTAVLGFAMQNVLSRTGVSRVVDQLARGIAANPELDVNFCNADGFSNDPFCYAYLHDVSGVRETFLAGTSLGSAARLDALFGLPKLRRSTNYVVRGVANRTTRFLHKRIALRTARVANEGGIFHSPFSPLPPDIRATDGRSARFLTIYDMIPLLHPEWFTSTTIASIAPLFQRIISSLRPTDHVHCISESTRNDLCNAVPSLDPNRVFVSTLAADAAVFYPDVPADVVTAVRTKYAIPEGQYLLSVCTLEPRKNIESVVRAFGRLITQERVSDLSLVLVGAKGWNTDTIDAALAEGHKHRSRVIITGFVPDVDLAPLYGGATAFVYPSQYEGFGLPPLEAMACGVPVITSNTSSLPEVVGDAGLMVPPFDLDALCHAIHQLTTNSVLRNDLAGRSLTRASTFSWERCVRGVTTAYRNALGG